MKKQMQRQMGFLNFLQILTNYYGIGVQVITNYQLLHRCLPSNQIMD